MINVANTPFFLLESATFWSLMTITLLANACLACPYENEDIIPLSVGERNYLIHKKLKNICAKINVPITVISKYFWIKNIYICAEKLV